MRIWLKVKVGALRGLTRIHGFVPDMIHLAWQFIMIPHLRFDLGTLSAPLKLGTRFLFPLNGVHFAVHLFR